METEQHYLRVGIYIVGLAVALILFAVWLLGDGTSNHRIAYRIYFNESVSGLNPGSPVKYRGVNVGTVSDIRIDKKNPQLIRVTAELDKEAPVKVGTVASLKLQGITGTVYIELSGGEAGAQDLVDATPKRQVPVIPSQASSIQAVMNQLPQIMEKLSRFTDQLAKLSSDENVARFNETLRNLSMLTGNLNTLTTDARGNVIESTEHLNGAMSDLRKASRDVRKVTDRVEEDPSSLIFSPPEEGIPAP